MSRPRIRRPAFRYRHPGAQPATIASGDRSASLRRCTCNVSAVDPDPFKARSPMDLLRILTGSCHLHGKR